MSRLPQSGEVARIVGTRSLFMALATVVTAGAEPADEAVAWASRFDEVRALWVIRTALDSPEEVREMVAEAAGSGFNTLLVQVRGRGDAFYASSLEPRAERLPDDPSFDPLQLVIDEAHARGMDVHAWVNTYLVWGLQDLPRSRLHLVNANPEWLAVPRSLGRDLYTRNPRDPRYVRRLTEHAQANNRSSPGCGPAPRIRRCRRECRRSGWSWPPTTTCRASTSTTCGCRPGSSTTRAEPSTASVRGSGRTWSARYADLVRESMPDPYAMADALRDLWDQFRRDQVSMLVRRIYRAVKEARSRPDRLRGPGPGPEGGSREALSGLVGLAGRRGPGRGGADGVHDRSRAVRRLGRGGTDLRRRRERVWVGVGAYKNPVNETLRQIEDARERGVGGVVLFAYDSASSTPAQSGTPTPLQQIGNAAFR